MVLKKKVPESTGKLNDDSTSSIDSPELIAAHKRLPTRVALLENEIERLRAENAQNKSMEVNGTVAVHSIGRPNESSHSNVPQIIRGSSFGSSKKIGIPDDLKGISKFEKPDNYVEGEKSEDINDKPLETLQCQWDSCTKEYSTHRSLVEHVYHRHIQHEKDYKCLWKGCKREEPFSSQHHLAHHVHRHTGEKPYNCNKGYADPSSLRTHLKKIHGDEAYEKAKKSNEQFRQEARDRAFRGGNPSLAPTPISHGGGGSTSTPPTGTTSSNGSSTHICSLESMEVNVTVAVISIDRPNESSHSSVPQIVMKPQQYAKVGRPRGRPLGSTKKIGILGDPKETSKFVKPDYYVGRESESEDSEYIDESESDDSEYIDEYIDVETLETRQCQWDSCTKEYSTHRSLAEHVYHRHIQHEKEYKCKWKGCKREEPFSHQHNLVHHVHLHTGEKPYVCKYVNCGKSYSRLENLKTHIRTHTGERPYQCQFPNCTKAFSNATARAKHQNRTHSDSKPYECTLSNCNKNYTDPSSLRKHIINIHGDEAYEKTRKNKPVRHSSLGRRHKLPIATQIQLGQLVPSTKWPPNKYYNPQVARLERDIAMLDHSYCNSNSIGPIATQIQLGHLVSSTKRQPTNYYHPQRCEEEQRRQEARDRAVREGNPNLAPAPISYGGGGGGPATAPSTGTTSSNGSSTHTSGPEVDR